MDKPDIGEFAHVLSMYISGNKRSWKRFCKFCNWATHEPFVATDINLWLRGASYHHVPTEVQKFSDRLMAAKEPEQED
jgi:hypothetical protein